MKKCARAKEDPYLGLLNHRNTPTERLDCSPSQRLMGRRTKTLVPSTSDVLQPSTIDPSLVKTNKENIHANVTEHYSNIRELPVLQRGDTVRVQPLENRNATWKQATVSGRVSARSYEITTDEGKSYRRNRTFLRKTTKSRSPTNTMTERDSPLLTNKGKTSNETCSEFRTEEQTSPMYTTRSGRTVKPARKLNL